MKQFVTSLFLFIALALNAMNVVFRYDDFRLATDSLDKEMIRLFVEKNIPISLAVVPCDADESFAINNDTFLDSLKHLVEDGKVEICLHGLTHQQIANGEFAEVSYDEQYRRLSKGKQFLDSVFQRSICTFIAPFNAYDATTLQVIKELGMPVLSGGLHSGQDWSNPAITYYPWTIDHPRQFKQAIDDNTHRPGTIILMYHHYDIDNGYNLDSLSNTLDYICSRKDVSATTFEHLHREGVSGSSHQAKINLEQNLLSKALRTKSMFHETWYIELVRIANIAIYIFIVLIIAICFTPTITKRRRTYITAQIIFALLIGCAVLFHLWSPMKLLVLSAIIPFGFALLFLIVNNTHKN